MKALLLLAALVPNLVALEITTLDGKTYTNCVVSKVYPDSICVLFSGSGARIKFANLPDSIRAQYGYDSQRATEFEEAEAARIQREQTFLAAQRQQAAQQRTLAAAAAITNQAAAAQAPVNRNPGSGSPGVSLAAVGPGGYNQSGGGLQGAYGNQFGAGFAGAQYVGVSMAGIRSVTVPTPTQARPPGGIFGP